VKVTDEMVERAAIWTHGSRHAARCALEAALADVPEAPEARHKPPPEDRLLELADAVEGLRDAVRQRDAATLEDRLMTSVRTLLVEYDACGEDEEVDQDLADAIEDLRDAVRLLDGRNGGPT
jgi:hypothetical protein